MEPIEFNEGDFILITRVNKFGFREIVKYYSPELTKGLIKQEWIRM